MSEQAIHTDVATFRKALQLARQTADVTVRRTHLETALGAYRGELLPGFYEDWILPERDLLTLAYRRALEELIELLERSGQPAEALSYALKHAACDPYDEKSYARLMRVYVAAGEPAEALRHYRILETRLREDLGESILLYIDLRCIEEVRIMPVNKELMKGSTATLILTLLSRKKMYGYELIKELELRSEGLFELREGTLYPILHSLEKAGLVTSSWMGEEGSRQRRYYSISKSGRAFLRDKKREWLQFKTAIDNIVLA